MNVDPAPNDDSVHVSRLSTPKREQRRADRDNRLAELARNQHGVVSRSQLHALGLTPESIRGRVRRGLLHRVYRGSYAVGHARLTSDGRLHAALLACGPDSFISHRTAAAFYGLRGQNLWQLDLTIATTHQRPRSGIVAHRSTREAHRHDVIRSSSGLHVSTVARTLVDLAATESDAELLRLITVGVRKRVLAHDRLQAAIARSARVPGIARLRRAYAAYLPRPDRKSGLERDFDLLLEQHPEIPAARRNVQLLGWEVDYHWPELGVVLELDGRPYHVAVADLERDRLKDAKLLAAGVLPLRVTDRRFNTDPDGAIGDLSTLLARRAGHAQPLSAADARSLPTPDPRSLPTAAARSLPTAAARSLPTAGGAQKLPDAA